VRLRPATPADLALLLSWDRKPHGIAATGADDFFPSESELPRSVPWRELRTQDVR
jgi:aminoglycoside 6'-N-acetyltransferase